MEAFSKTTEMTLHGIAYIIKINVKDQILNIELEEKETGDVWKDSFMSSYIEEITRKTGNFKTFDVFAKMLLSAVTKSSETVFIDILSPHDLEMLKAKNQKQALNRSAIQPNNAKRYMILSYSVEFDKVNYPLPLSYEEVPNVPALKNTIKTLRSEVDTLRSKLSENKSQSDNGFFMTAMGQPGSLSELEALKAENETLRERLRRSEIFSAGGDPKKMGAVELDVLLKSKIDLENELENIKKEYVRDVKKVKTRLEEVEAERKDLLEEIARLRLQMPEIEFNDVSKRSLNNSKAEDPEVSYLRKLLTKHQKEAEKYRQEVDSLKILENKQKARIKQLEMDLQSSRNAGTRNKGASPNFAKPRDLNLKITADKRSASVSKSLSPAFKATANNRAVPNNRVTVKAMPANMPVNRGMVGGNIRQRNQISPGLRSPNPLDKKVSPRSGPYAKGSPQHLSPLSRNYNAINSKLSPSNKLGELRINNYMGAHPSPNYASASKVNLKLDDVGSADPGLMIMGAGSKGVAPGNPSIVNQGGLRSAAIQPAIQEHYL